MNPTSTSSAPAAGPMAASGSGMSTVTAFANGAPPAPIVTWTPPVLGNALPAGSQLATVPAVTGVKPWPTPIPASAFCANPPETPPVLIAGILYQGGTMLVAGPSKARKTFTLLDAGLSIASGLPWLGWNTQQAVVLYLNLELPPHLMAARLSAICQKREVTPPASLVVMNLRGHGTDIDTIKRELPKFMAAFKVGVVIIDPHYKVSATSGMEENSNDDQGCLLAELEALCGNAGAALIIAHHFAKGLAADKNAIDRASGGGVFARWPDAFMSMSNHQEEGAMTVELALRAFAPVKPFGIRWVYPVWERDINLNPAQLQRAGAKNLHPAEELLAKLTDGMTGPEWGEAIGWKDTTYRTKRKELTATNRVREANNRFFLNPSK